MTYPQELREHTYFSDPSYPINIFRIRQEPSHAGALSLYMHWHEHFEILLMIKGRATFHIDSKPYEAEPGDIVIVPSGALHVGYSACAGPLEYYAIVFNASLLKSNKATDSMHTVYIAPYLDGSLLFPIRLRHTDTSNAVFKSVLDQVIQEFVEKQRGYELIIKSHMYILFTLLSRQFMPDQLPEKVKASHSRNVDRFKKLLLYINAHYQEPITVAQAASIVNLNPYHFCKTFKKTTGSTLIEYINFVRMNAAERLLQDSDLTVTEIAEHIGCGNPNYFTKLFKQYKGIAPSQWRKDALRYEHTP